MSEELFVGEEYNPGNDPVISEVPVYLNAAQQPYVLQYPTRKFTERAKEQTASKVRLKPNTGMLEVDIANDMPENLHDKDKSSRWQDLSHQTFGGMLKPAHSRYAIGKLEQDGLYLTLVDKIAQLRPHFDHFNQQTKEEKERLNPKDERPAKIHSVLTSAKSSSENTSRYSEVIDFYKHVAVEHQEVFEVGETGKEQMKVLSKQ